LLNASRFIEWFTEHVRYNTLSFPFSNVTGNGTGVSILVLIQDFDLSTSRGHRDWRLEKEKTRVPNTNKKVNRVFMDLANSVTQISYSGKDAQNKIL
jgi:hypothetical protein